MIQFEANNEKVNWYSETEMRTLFNAVLSAYSKTTDINAAITSAINGLGNLSRINKSGNANEYLNGAGNWSTVSSGTTYTLPAATSSQLGGVKIGNNIANSSGTISVSDANASTKGVSKLYTSTGTATDGSMTQAAIKTELDKKITSSTKVASAEKADSLATARTINGFPFDGSSNIVFYGTCTTAADVAEKEVTIEGFTLTAETVICVNFRNGNTALNPTLNVNGLGAKEIVGVIQYETRLSDKPVFLVYNTTWRRWHIVGCNKDCIVDRARNAEWQLIENADLNELTTPGFYVVRYCTNMPGQAFRPSSTYYFLICCGRDRIEPKCQILISGFENKQIYSEGSPMNGRNFYYRGGPPLATAYTMMQPWNRVNATTVDFYSEEEES